MFQRGRVLASLALVVGLVLSGCSNSDEPDPIPEVKETTAPVEPTPTEPTWESKYNEQELAAFEAALDRWTEYETRAAPIWAAGKATPEAESFFKDYWADPAWRLLPYSQLQTFESVEVKSERLPTVLWTRPRKINATKNGNGSVVLVQCVDYTSVSTTQYGKKVELDKVFSKPVQRTIDLSRSEGYPWLIYNLIEPTKENFKRCEGDSQ